MIVLRKIGQSTNVLLGQELSGTIDGVNKTFTTPHVFKEDKIVVNYNGQELISSVDFEVTGANEITFVYVAPREHDELHATYERAT